MHFLPAGAAGSLQQVQGVSQSQVLVIFTWGGILTAWLYPNALQAAALVHILIYPDSVLTNLEYAVLQSLIGRCSRHSERDQCHAAAPACMLEC